MATSLKRRDATATQVLLSLEFLAPFDVFAATTMAIGAVVVFMRVRSLDLAAIDIGLTLFYIIGAVVAFRGRAKLRKY